MSRRLQRPASCATDIATNWFERVMLRSFRPLWCRFARDSNSCLGTSLRNCARTVLLWDMALTSLFSIGIRQTKFYTKERSGHSFFPHFVGQQCYAMLLK